MSEKANLKAIIVLGIIGILISGYLLYIKYSGATSFCDFSEEVSCDTVSQSPFAEFPANSGIPISALGIIAFLIFITPAYMILKNKNPDNIIFSLDKGTVYNLMLLWGAFSILFYIYLTYLELYVIYAICPLCVVTFIITIIMVALIIQNWRGHKGKGK